MDLTWVEISKKALAYNFRAFRRILKKNIKLMPVVKSNAYGHDLLGCAALFEKEGADYLGVNSWEEAETLRKNKIKIPLLILGYVPLSHLKRAIGAKAELTVYNPETIQALGRLKKPASIHLKIETGTHRQGITSDQLGPMIRVIKKYNFLKLKGVSTHFADIEDSARQTYAQEQLLCFRQAINSLEKAGYSDLLIHAANTAATLLLPTAYFSMARPGIGCYGLWPSAKIRSAIKKKYTDFNLKPALTWKTRVVQIKTVQKGALVGYGCTYKMPHDGRIAILPIGYYDGYVRLLSNKGQVLIRGQRAPVIGRICMNMTMVDVTRIPNVRLEDEVVLLGRQGSAEVTAEEHAEWTETINYEVTTRINERIPRLAAA